MRNEQIEQNKWTSYTTFPERLEDNGISWRFYQNELTIKTGLSEEEDAWLSNYGCNIMENFPQFHAKAYKLHRDFIEKQEKLLPGRIDELKKQLAARTWPRRNRRN